MTIFQDNLSISPDNIKWRGPVCAPIRSKKNAVAAMASVAKADGPNFFKVEKKGSRWFVIVGQAA